MKQSSKLIIVLSYMTFNFFLLAKSQFLMSMGIYDHITGALCIIEFFATIFRPSCFDISHSSPLSLSYAMLFP
jgi:hypothetical protein